MMTTAEIDARSKAGTIRAAWVAENPEPVRGDYPSAQKFRAAITAYLGKWHDSEEFQRCSRIMREAFEGK